MESELEQEFAQLFAHGEEGQRHANSLKAKTKEALIKLKSDVDHLEKELTRYKSERDSMKEQVTRYREDRGQMEEEIAELKEKLGKKDEENRSLRVKIRELEAAGKDSHGQRVHERDHGRKRSTSSNKDDETSLSSRDGKWAYDGKRKRHQEKPIMNDRPKYENLELYKFDGLRQLTNSAYHREMEVRNERRWHMVVLDRTPETGRSLEDVRKLVNQLLSIDVAWSLVETISDSKAIVQVENFDDKVAIVGERHRFEHVYQLCFVNHRTDREREIQDRLRALAAKEEENGKVTKLQYMGICIDGVWWRWSESRFRLELDWRYNNQKQ